jgi:hypothetical protein
MKTGAITGIVGFTKTDGAIKQVVRLNIGLNNNPHSTEDILSTVELFLSIDSHSVQVGKWEGADEPTLVVTGLTERSFDAIKDIVSALTLDLTQEAIAFKYGGKGVLEYNPHYQGDERYEFDEEYFI